MAKGLIGKKLGMTQIFQDNGAVVPVTVILAGPNVVTQKKTIETDGYNAVQFGFEDQKEHRINKPEKGHFKRAGVNPKKHLAEFRDFPEDLKEGDQVTVDLFSEGEMVDIVGVSKGKGFAGTVKRYNFGRGPMTHGSHNHRSPGSIGAVDAARVFKGKKLPGRMGNDRVTIQNLEVIKVDSEKDIILVKGSIPGPKNSIIYIQEAVKD